MITINDIDIATLGLFMRYGSKEELLRMPSLKPAITNTSRDINGVQIDARNAKVEARTVTLYFYLEGKTEFDYLNKLEALTELLKTGKNGSGITEIGLLRYIFKLRFERCDKVSNFGDRRGLFDISFFEPNPLDR